MKLQYVLLFEKDARYYDLLEHMLVAQAFGNKAFPLAADLAQDPRLIIIQEGAHMSTR